MHATSFLRQLEADDGLRAAISAACGDLPRILALAGEHGYRVTAEELEQARVQLYGSATPPDHSHPAVYFDRPGEAAGSPQARTRAEMPDYSHPAVYFC